jgi:pyruvate/2-oxoglutarate dehydrogenase complex dihydrolipoamide dehydrogenase (E3) component
MADVYDLVVIGAGSAGLSAASLAARLGVRVALVERNRIGGDCTWTGCVPSKALLHSARIAHQMRHANVFGLEPATPKVDLAAVMDRVRAAIDRVYQSETPEALTRQGIDVIKGAARFVDPLHVEVDGRVVRGRRFLITTGARAVIPRIPGLDGIPYHTYETVFDLRVAPSRLLVLGAGPVGIELGQAFQRLGSQVTLLDAAPRVLPVAHPAASAILARRLGDEGVVVRTGASIKQVTLRDGAIVASVDGDEHEGDALLVAVGRRPDLDGLGLERALIRVRDGAIIVDHRLRTSQRHIYAAGDVTGGVQFTHYAGWQAAIAVRNALLPGSSRGIPAVVPWVVFTDPEIAEVGVTERAARQQGLDIRVTRWPVERIDRAQTAADDVGFLDLVARPNDTLIGATVVASAAGELVNELALAITRGLTLRELATALHAYPTYGIAIEQAAAEAVVARLTAGWRGRLLGALIALTARGRT